MFSQAKKPALSATVANFSLTALESRFKQTGHLVAQLSDYSANCRQPGNGLKVLTGTSLLGSYVCMWQFNHHASSM